MPGGEDTYHLLRAKDERSNSKADTFFIRPRGIGTPDKQIESFHTEAIDGDVTGGAGEITDLTGTNLSVTNGVLEASGGAPPDASYVTTAAEAGLSNETVADDLRSVFGTPVTVGTADLQLESSQSIEDEDGFNRFEVATPSKTSVNDGIGDPMLSATGLGPQVDVYDGKGFSLVDNFGGFDAASYAPSSASPGTFTFSGADVDMSGNDISNTGSVAASSVSTESLVIGGRLFEQDDNSPINVSGVSSHTYQIAGDYSEVIILPDHTTFPESFDQVQVNGFTDSGYEWQSEDGTISSGSAIGTSPIEAVKSISVGHWARISRAIFAVDSMINDGMARSGQYDGTGSVDSLDSLTFSRSDGSDAALKARVLGRSPDV